MTSIDKRIRLIKEGTTGKGPVIYWMSRDQRIHDNWALIYAQTLALKQSSPLVVAFCLACWWLVGSLVGSSLVSCRI